MKPFSDRKNQIYRNIEQKEIIHKHRTATSKTNVYKEQRNTRGGREKKKKKKKKKKKEERKKKPIEYDEWRYVIDQ
jgi:hypothetical protein